MTVRKWETSQVLPWLEALADGDYSFRFAINIDWIANYRIFPTVLK